MAQKIEKGYSYNKQACLAELADMSPDQREGFKRGVLHGSIGGPVLAELTFPAVKLELVLGVVVLEPAFEVGKLEPKLEAEEPDPRLRADGTLMPSIGRLINMPSREPAE